MNMVTTTIKLWAKTSSHRDAIIADYSPEDAIIVVILVSFSSFQSNFHCFQLCDVMKIYIVYWRLPRMYMYCTFCTLKKSLGRGNSPSRWHLRRTLYRYSDCMDCIASINILVIRPVFLQLARRNNIRNENFPYTCHPLYIISVTENG